MLPALRGRRLRGTPRQAAAEEQLRPHPRGGRGQGGGHADPHAARPPAAAGRLADRGGQRGRGRAQHPAATPWARPGAGQGRAPGGLADASGTRPSGGAPLRRGGPGRGARGDGFLPGRARRGERGRLTRPGPGLGPIERSTASPSDGQGAPQVQGGSRRRRRHRRRPPPGHSDAVAPQAQASRRPPNPRRRREEVRAKEGRRPGAEEGDGGGGDAGISRAGRDRQTRRADGGKTEQTDRACHGPAGAGMPVGGPGGRARSGRRGRPRWIHRRGRERPGEQPREHRHPGRRVHRRRAEHGLYGRYQ